MTRHKYAALFMIIAAGTMILMNEFFLDIFEPGYSFLVIIVALLAGWWLGPRLKPKNES